MSALLRPSRDTSAVFFWILMPLLLDDSHTKHVLLQCCDLCVREGRTVGAGCHQLHCYNQVTCHGAWCLQSDSHPTYSVFSAISALEKGYSAVICACVKGGLWELVWRGMPPASFPALRIA